MKTCPTCGHRGDQEHCPDDGDRMLSDAELAAITAAEPTQAPPEMTQREHATAAGPRDEALRGEDFGKWAEPEIKPKPQKDPMIGRTIGGRYEVVGLLGKGGMGAVYKARQPAVQRTIALKVLLQEFAENETVIRRFHQEALAASRLTHPNTISVYDFGQTDDGVLYIAMEYLRGESLAQALKAANGMAPRRAIHIMRQVCKSLAEAHRAGIIHRDLKPDNIFLTQIQGERDFVKVLDFGVAKLKEYEGKEGTLTQAGMIFGTPKYMSPEQARSTELDARSDVYALGIILYEMLLGRPPFSSDNPLSILISHVNEQPEPFKKRRPDLDVMPALEAVVFKALAKDRAARHATVDELGVELEAIAALLEGAPYETVAERLPPSAQGRTGADSIMGPAILPDSTAGTMADVDGTGDTVVLQSGETPQLTETTPLAVGEVVLTGERPGFTLDEPPPSGKSGLLAVLLGVPAAAAAVWFFGFRTPDPPERPTPVVTVVQDAAVALPTRPDAAVAPIARAPADAAVRAPDATTVAAAPSREFVLSSDPDGAKIIEIESGERIGTTYQRLTVAVKTEYQLEKAGYEPLRFTLDPEDEEVNKKFRLRALPEAPRPVKKDPPKKDTETATVRIQPNPVVGPAKKPPPDKPIDLE